MSPVRSITVTLLNSKKPSIGVVFFIGHHRRFLEYFDNYYIVSQMRETLINDMCLLRAMVETQFSEGSAHPRYLPFNPENPAYGQCGVVTKKLGDYLLQITTRARMTTAIQQGIRDGEYDDFRIHQMFAEDNPQIRRLRRFTRDLERTRFEFAYGELRKTGTDELISDDHCWLRAIDVTNNEGYDNTVTDDQFSTPELSIPPVMVQTIGRPDGQSVYHIARDIEVIDFNSRGNEGFNKRLAQLAFHMRPVGVTDKSDAINAAWELESENPRIAQRVNQLKKQYFPRIA